MIHLDNNLPNVNRKGLFHKLDRNSVNTGACPGIRKRGGPKSESLFFFFFLLFNFSGGGAQLKN